MYKKIFSQVYLQFYTKNVNNFYTDPQVFYCYTLIMDQRENSTYNFLQNCAENRNVKAKYILQYLTHWVAFSVESFFPPLSYRESEKYLFQSVAGKEFYAPQAHIKGAQA
jgi:hypothetical protein